MPYHAGITNVIWDGVKDGVLDDGMLPGEIYPEASHISTGNRRAIGDCTSRLGSCL